MLAKFAAVVAGGDAQDIRRGDRRVEAATQRGLDGIEAETVDHDFIDGVAPGGQLGRNERTQCRAVSLVRAGLQFGIPRSHLAARTHDPAGERQRDIRFRADGFDGGFGGDEGRTGVRATNQKIATRDTRHRAELVLAEELAVHDGDAPVALIAQLF